MKLHQKGFLLVALSHVDTMWDDQIIALAAAEYGRSGPYFDNTIRIALDELASAGLISRIEEKLARAGDLSTLMFRYRLSDFGRTRMMDTGLLDDGRAA